MRKNTFTADDCENRKNVRFNWRTDEAIIRKLKVEAAATGVPASTVLEAALLQYLAGKEVLGGNKLLNQAPF